MALKTMNQTSYLAYYLGKNIQNYGHGMFGATITTTLLRSGTTHNIVPYRVTYNKPHMGTTLARRNTTPLYLGPHYSPY